MTYNAFLDEFAKIYGFDGREDLLERGAERYSFQIRSRDRGSAVAGRIGPVVGSWEGKRVLDVGCAYGSFCVELAKVGASVVGVDINKKWLRLAEINADDEDVDVEFVLGDASSMECRHRIPGKFDVVIINDGLEHIYDTAGLLGNVRSFLADEGVIFFKVPNGMATTSVISEGHKKVFGVSLLAPDYWGPLVKSPFSIYYRRWDYYEALFRQFGVGNVEILNECPDESREQTEAHVRRGLRRVKNRLRELRRELDPRLGSWLAAAVKRYAFELESDLETLDWYPLYFKYRVTFWEGLARLHGQERGRTAWPSGTHVP